MRGSSPIRSPLLPEAGAPCPMPESGSAGQIPRWGRWIVGWHLLFYAMLVGFTVSAAASRPAAAALALNVALAGLLGAWYAWLMVLRPDLVAGSARMRLTYFCVAAVLWAGLVGLDRNFTNLGIIAAVELFGYLRLRAAMAGMLVVTLVWLAGDSLQGSLGAAVGLRWRGLRWDQVASAAFSLMLLVLCLFSFRELARTRSELAASERRAGVLGERQRIAGDIHDTLTQGLASVVMLLEAAQAAHREGTPEVGRRIEEAASAAREGLRDVRRLVWDLRPEALERGTLGEALTRMTARLEEETGVTARTAVTGAARPLAPPLEVTLLRVAQESLANVRRHACAGEVNVTLSYIEDEVALDVQDDGRGFDPAKQAAARLEGGLGLTTMRERVETLGGTLTVESTPGEGATVVAQLPLQAPARLQTGTAGR